MESHDTKIRQALWIALAVVTTHGAMAHTVNGPDPVVVTYFSHAPKIGVVLNGFELTETLPAATSR